MRARAAAAKAASEGQLGVCCRERGSLLIVRPPGGSLLESPASASTPARQGGPYVRWIYASLRYASMLLQRWLLKTATPGGRRYMSLGCPFPIDLH